MSQTETYYYIFGLIAAISIILAAITTALWLFERQENAKKTKNTKTNSK